MVLVAWVVVRSKVSWRRLLDVLAMLPIGTSAIMMGIALVFIFFGFRAVPIYGTIWVIAIGHAIVYLPFSARTVQAAMLQLSREQQPWARVEVCRALAALDDPRSLKRLRSLLHDSDAYSAAGSWRHRRRWEAWSNTCAGRNTVGSISSCRSAAATTAAATTAPGSLTSSPRNHWPH